MVYMDQELIGRLTEKVERLLTAYTAIKGENQKLRAELRQVQERQQAVRTRIDDLLGKLEGIDGL
jgi:cell division protein ZapB